MQLVSCSICPCLLITVLASYLSAEVSVWWLTASTEWFICSPRWLHSVLPTHKSGLWKQNIVRYCSAISPAEIKQVERHWVIQSRGSGIQDRKSLTGSYTGLYPFMFMNPWVFKCYVCDLRWCWTFKTTRPLASFLTCVRQGHIDPLSKNTTHSSIPLTFSLSAAVHSDRGLKMGCQSPITSLIFFDIPWCNPSSFSIPPS